MITEKEIELRASFEKILPMGIPSLLEKCVKISEEYASIVNERKDNIGVWVKASERMPEKEGYYHGKRLSEPIILYARKDKNYKMYFSTPNGMQFNGWKNFLWLDESQLQQKGKQEEESEKELEERTDRNMNVISDFCEHVKSEVGLVIPESAILSFFNA